MYEELGVFVLPGETLSIEALYGGRNDKYELKAEHGRVSRPKVKQWLWRAPQIRGRYRVRVASRFRLTLQRRTGFTAAEFLGPEMEGARRATGVSGPKNSSFKPVSFDFIFIISLDTIFSPFFLILCPRKSGAAHDV